ncbi:MAG: pyridine nucleotide-disulfide oxidoreductase/dicluster-binding protein [Lentihominibacter sp.]
MKEVRDFYNRFDTCRERDIPLCSEACPFKVDIIPLMERITAGRFNAAYKAYRDNVVFPGIVSEICPGYCRDACIRKGFDEALNLPLIEKSIIGLASRRQPNSYNLPDRSEKVAVIGSGISGMAFALKMATRKYDVTIFEKEASIGGRLKSLMDESIYMGEFDLQFSNEKYTLLCSTEAQVDISNGAVTAVTGGQAQRFEDFSVVYVATGAETSPDIEAGSPPFIEAGNTGIFYGGSMLGSDTMHALVDGIKASAIADSYMKTGIYEAPEAPEPSGCVANEDMLVPTETVHPAATIYSEEECREEASRCIKCKCDACESSCDLVRFYKKWPIKMRDEIFLSVKPAGSLVHKCPSRKYIAACTQCTMLENACPESIDLCGMIKSARHEMHNVDKMPAAYRQYFMRDMAFANGEFAKIVKGGGKYGFFPGCNLGALNPEYVIKSYKWILQQFPDTGLLLRCCGIPADWAGNTERHMEEINQLRAEWTEMGKPVIITACMSCDKHLREYLPEIETVSLYELYAEHLKLPDSRSPSQECVEARTFTVFDPCSARGLDSVQEAVRDIAEAHGMRIDEFPKNDQHGCCGYGGQGSIAQPLFAKYVTEERACMSDNPYLVYCSNCRDVFNAEGKEAIHILDVMFDIDSEGTAPVPSLTDRRNNRIILKEALLNEIWSEEMTNKPEISKYQLVMKDDILAKAERLRILEDDICNVIDHAETTGRRTRSPETGHYRAYREIGAITLWVEYGAGEGNIREIHNIYTHRMQIKLEAVFNGRKTDEQE